MSVDRRFAPLALLLAACPSSHPAPATPRVIDAPSPTVRVGECGTPDHDGVVGAAPRLRRADRDLDGDGRAESVVADETMCTHEGNCYWNVFVHGDGDGACDRYAGSLAGQVLEPLPGAAGRLADVRTYWNLTGGGHMLVHEYQFRRGGYVLTDTLLCRRADDDRLRCTEDVR